MSAVSNAVEKPEMKLSRQGHAELFRSNVVVVGANGSGKSRLGAWVEENNKATHRISAQRALTFRATPQLKEREAAERLLRYGHETLANRGARRTNRWGNSPSNHVLNDFDALMATLLARQRARDSEHSRQVAKVLRTSTGPTVDRTAIRRPDCETDRIAALWRRLFPHRKLLFLADKVCAKPKDGAVYDGPDMSDGERVALYLAGQVLCAEPCTILIFDEPELHLHRAVLAPLWDALEEARPDCLFLYLTHDVQFAATRAGCTRIWMRSWDGNSTWDWERIADTSGLPDDLLLSVLGSRRACLFVEGDAGSLDYELLSLAYDERYVIPRGSCEKVIETTKAYREYAEPHHIEAEGLIDRDHRSDEEIRAYRERGIRVLPVAEIENLLLTEAVVRFVARRLSLDGDVTFDKVRAFVRESLAAELDSQIKERAVARARVQLSRFAGAPRGGQQAFVDALDGFARNLDARSIWRESEEAFRAVLAADDHRAILRLYNRKSLVNRVSRSFGLADGSGYVDYCRRLARSGAADGDLRAILRDEVERPD